MTSLSTDLVTRLREHANRDNCVSHDWGGAKFDAGEDCAQAADEIEQLRGLLRGVAGCADLQVCDLCRDLLKPYLPSTRGDDRGN